MTSPVSRSEKKEMPTVYYSDDFVTLYHARYEDVVGTLGEVDAVVTDPPYGDTSLAWDRSPAFGWLARVKPLLKPSGSVWTFASLRYLLALQPELAAWNLAQEVVWEKHNGSSFHADRFKRVHEYAVQLYPSDAKWAAIHKVPVMVAEATKRTVRRKKRPPHTGHIEASSYASEDGGPKLMRSVIYARSCHGYAIHPTQKPNEIVRPLIEYSCPVGGVVLDIFAGSGTILEEARALGRRAIGIEVHEHHCEKAAVRLAASRPTSEGAA
jgi:site-specific DNA-methyltransferase (adenine-specific)